MRAVQSGTAQSAGAQYADRVIPKEPTQTEERRARIEQMIDEYRLARQRRLVQRATDLWRKTEVRQQLLKFEAPAQRVH